MKCMYQISLMNLGSGGYVIDVLERGTTGVHIALFSQAINDFDIAKEVLNEQIESYLKDEE